MNKTDRNGLVGIIILLTIIGLFVWVNHLYKKFKEKILYINLQPSNMIPLTPPFAPIGPIPSIHIN